MSICKFQLVIHTSQISKKCLLSCETKLHINLKALNINEKYFFKDENKNTQGWKSVSK